MHSELERCRPWIEAALAYSGGTHEWQDIVDGLASGHLQLWPAERGCIVTELTRYPRRLVCNCFLGGGELDQLLDMHEAIEAWARAQGCSALTIAGRLGWKRPLERHGWEPLHMSMKKELSA